MRFRLVALNEERVVEELLRGNLDLAFVEGHAVPDLPDELAHEPLGDLVFALHAPPGHAPADDPAQERIIVLTGAEGEVPNIVATVASVEVAEILACSGHLLALLPVTLAPPSFACLGGPVSRMPVGAIVRRALGDGGSSTSATTFFRRPAPTPSRWAADCSRGVFPIRRSRSLQIWDGPMRSR